MPRLYLVRHGRAAAGFGEAADPGLDALGHGQAMMAAERLAPNGPLAIRSSPLKRARETAGPLAERWKRDLVIEPGIAEIPSPPEPGLTGRAEWLSGVMAGSWRDTSRELAEWREAVLCALASVREDCVMFSHFVAINVAAGAALNDERVTVFRPDNGSITVIDADGERLRLIALGQETETRVN